MTTVETFSIETLIIMTPALILILILLVDSLTTQHLAVKANPHRTKHILKLTTTSIQHKIQKHRQENDTSNKTEDSQEQPYQETTNREANKSLEYNSQTSIDDYNKNT